MKNKLLLNTLRSVKKAPGRFIAITSIIAISCAFYSGLKASCPDMKNSAWKYYDEYALADIHLKSTLGFAEGDAERLASEEPFGDAYAGYSADLLVDGDNGQAVVKVMSYSADYPMNKLYLTEGRLPENPNECIADADADVKVTLDVGSTVKLLPPDGEELEDYLSSFEYTVVGKAKSPLYVTFDRGATTVGTGSLSAFLYVPQENFTYESYTDMYLSVPAAHTDGVKPFSDEYENIVDKAEYHAETLASSFLAERSESIRSEAEEEIADAEKELADGEKEYNEGYLEYKDGLKKYNNAFSELSSQRTDFNSAKTEYEDGLKAIEENTEKLTRLQETCPWIDDILEDYDGVYMKVLPQQLLDVFKEIQAVYDENDVDAAVSDLLAVYIISNPQKDPHSKAAAKAAIIGVNDQVRVASEAALAEIKNQKAALEESGKLINETETALAEYEAELAKSKHELDDAKTELDEAKADIDEAKAEIADARAEIESLVSDSEWYVWNRGEFNPGCMSYGTDAERVDSIAAAFPVFFILIAALVCCTTMSRMVEEQRTEAGTLKALGFGSCTIIMQYVMYAATASIVGSVIGTIAGFPLLPNVLFKCYDTMYNYPEFEAPFMMPLALCCIGVSLMCTVLSAVYTSAAELSLVPALLIRPKPPKDGKRIFLEKIGFIWKHMKFTYKVTFRNLLRYKSRFFMTIIGIGGCTALLLTAFGLKEAIACIIDKQYDELFLYDAMAVVSDKADEEEKSQIEAVIASNDVIISHMSAVQESKDVYSDIGNRECYIFAPSDKDGLSDYIVLRDRLTGERISLADGSVVINEKLGRMLGISEGDSITIEGASSAVTVADITENYTFHYLYMTYDTYKVLFGEKDFNMILMNTGSTPEKSVREDISSQLVKCDGVISASFMYDGADSFRKLVSSLNLIVVVLIIFAGALSLLILFNLANININERVRELATIKVLGFFDSEVGSYIYRENTVSAVIGIICGLGLGILFERFVVKTAEVDEVMFSPDIPWFCFILAAAVMVMFALIVNMLLYFKLKKIDMASSMKAIE